MDIENNNFFHVNVIILKWAGIWIPTREISTKLKIWYIMYNSFWITYSCIIFTPFELLSFGRTFSNLTEFVRNVNMGMTHLLALIKISLWFYRRNDILKIVRVLGDYSSIYESYDIFDFNGIIAKERVFKDIATKGFLTSALSVSVTACLAALKSLLVDTEKADAYAIGNGTQLVAQNLPYHSLIPFNYTTSKFGFALAILYQCFGVFNFGWIIVGLDTLYVAMLSYISAHLQIIQGAFKTIRPRCLRRLGLPHVEVLHDSNFVDDEMIFEMNKITRHLQVILNVCKEVENIYTYVTLAQVLISLVVYCTCLYMVSSIPISSADFATHFIYLLAIQCQLGIYCFFGNRVALSSAGIPLALYEGDWLSTSNSFKKSMIITMCRMLLPIHFTMGKFSPLTLSTFVTISRGSYSFFTVLKNSERFN